jgi:hypothetical protein
MPFDDFARAALGAVAVPHPETLQHQEHHCQMSTKEDVLFPSFLDPAFVTTILSAKDNAQAKDYITRKVEAYQRRLSPQFNPQISINTLTNVNFITTIRTSRFGTAKYQTTVDDAWSSINPLFLLATVKEDSSPVIPHNGITGFQAKLMLDNMGFLLTLIYENPGEAYPHLRVSPWTMRGILPGLLLALRNELEATNFVHHWDIARTTSNGDSIAKSNTLAWIQYLNQLFGHLLEWVEIIFTSHSATRLPLQYAKHMDGCPMVLALNATTSHLQSLASVLKNWLQQFPKVFSKEHILNPSTRTSDFKTPLAHVFQEPPPYSGLPKQKPTRSTQRQNKGTYPQVAQQESPEITQGKHNQTTLKASQPLLTFKAPSEALAGKLPEGHNRWSVAAALKAIATKNDSAKDKFPIVLDGNQLCLQYLMTGRGCTNGKGKRPCPRLHLDLPNQRWTKDKLQPLTDCLQDPYLKQSLAPTDALKPFLNWPENDE